MTTTATLTATDFKVADLSLADFGRKEIQLAEHEMPGLMSLRRQYAGSQPLAGGGLLDAGLEVLGQAKVDPRRRGLVGIGR